MSIVNNIIVRMVHYKLIHLLLVGIMVMSHFLVVGGEDDTAKTSASSGSTGWGGVTFKYSFMKGTHHLKGFLTSC